MIFFYTLSTICLVSCTLVIRSRNPIYSLLSLVVFFVSGSIHLLYLGADYMMYIFIIIYAGALAVLFLFIVIILDIKLSKKNKVQKKVPLVFLSALAGFAFLDVFFPYEEPEFPPLIQWASIIDEISCIKTLGLVLYTKYVIHFVLCGFILLVAIIGAIVLTSKDAYQKTKHKEKHFKQSESFGGLGKQRI